MNLKFSDSHAHLTDDRFKDDLPQVIEAAVAAGVERIIDVGIDRCTSVLALEHASKYPEVLATVGLHPHDAKNYSPALIDFFDNLAADSRVVAIGETGLDRFYNHSPWDIQVENFEAHLELARRNGLPLVIHCREAYVELAEILARWHAQDHPAWHVHCYSGTLEELAPLLELDCYYSVGGMATFKNFSAADVVRAIPTDRLLLETDCPYLAPVPRRGKRNEPSFLVHTAARVAEIRGVSLEELARTTTENFERMFVLDK
jgi:TatD DNase family protein